MSWSLQQGQGWLKMQCCTILYSSECYAHFQKIDINTCWELAQTIFFKVMITAPMINGQEYLNEHVCYAVQPCGVELIYPFSKGCY